jgi:hypothetical protein
MIEDIEAFPDFILMQNKDPLHTLEEICSTARTVEEVVLGWVERGQTLVVALNPEVPWPAIGFSFVRGKKVVAIANIPIDRLMASYPAYEGINDKILEFSDQEGFLPDHEWFDKRNERLGIHMDKSVKLNRFPAACLGEVALSYALSEVGYAEISFGRRVGDQQYLKVSMVYFGPEVEAENAGWYEKGVVSLNELRDFVPRAVWV